VIGQRTYIQVGGTSGNVASIGLDVGARPFLSLQEVNGDFVAKRVVQDAEFEIVDLPDKNLLQEVEKKTFEGFLSREGSKNLSTEDQVPHKVSLVGGMLDHPLSNDEIQGIEQVTKLMMLVGFVNWSDVAGRHGQEICQVVSFIQGGKVTTNKCSVHDGYVDNVVEETPLTKNLGG
jgi:hypothetical protein